MDTNDISRRSSHSLKSHDPGGVYPNPLAHPELKERKHHVADRITACHGSAKSANERREDGPGGADQGSDPFS